MRLETQVVDAPDGVQLFVRSYWPDQYEPTRTVYWVHGVGEHGGRYEHIAREFTSRGWRLILADLRGHGRSTGVRTHVRSFDEYSDDMLRIWEKLDLVQTPPVLLGHSMGGLVVVRALQTGRVAPSSLILSSPLLGLKLHINPVSVFLGSMLVRVIPTARFSNGIDPTNMTRDSEFAAIRREDTLINKTVTAGWYFAMRDALSAGQRDALKVTLPVLSLQGSLDQTTDPAAMADWWERIRSTDKTLMVLEDHLHELFFESDWQQTTMQLLDWLDHQQVRSSQLDLKER